MERIVEAVSCDYNQLRQMVQQLQDKYPFLKVGVCGRSWAGRAIFTLSLGDSEDLVLYAGAFHGQEWLTALLLLRFCEDICDGIIHHKEIAEVNVATALFGRGITLIPCVNPDGVEIALHGASGAGHYMGQVNRISHGHYEDWNANARGVDINHNFNAGWQELRKEEVESGIYGPAPRRFGGTSPESEPETRALVRFCRQHMVRHALAMHSQGEEIYWKYGPNTPEKSLMMAKIFFSSSGYALSSPEGMAATGGGFKDWFIETFQRPAFTIEVGKGKNPLPLADFDAIYRRIQEMLLLACVM